MTRLALLPIVLALPSPALACGGFFCDGGPSPAPIDQAAERIVFAVDPDAGEVTAHVQITYTGEAHDFAWVVPVSAVPDLFLSNDALFTTLANQTIPTFTLQTDTSGLCSGPRFGVDYSVTQDAGGVADTGAFGGVNVVSQETVGPYDTVVLQADDATKLVDWLQKEGYGVPDTLDDAMKPYVAANQFFVALKLKTDASTGDLAPLGMRYAGTAASIPLQLTSIAAQPDMPLEVFVLGKSRAVPDNYLHVRINEAAIDWYAGGTNYRSVVSRAADEAGGQAFATDFSGPTSAFAGQIYSPTMVNLDQLRAETDPLNWLQDIVFSVPASSQLTAFLASEVPPPEGVDAATFLQCPLCYEGQIDASGFDASAATDALVTNILDPLAAAQQMVDGASWMTRLTSSMDASEMTVDPLFVFNADLPQDVSNLHTAFNHIHCGTFEGTYGGERTLELDDGRQIDLPSSKWFADHGDTELDYMADLASPAAIVIEDLGAEGQGTIVFDYRDQAAKDAKHLGGCGCDSTSRSAAGVPVALLLAGAMVRRRRS